MRESLSSCRSQSRLISSRVRRKSNPRVPAVKHDKLRLEHDVAQNLQRMAVVALNRPLAHSLGPRRRRKVDQRAGNRGHVAVAETEVEIGQLGVAGKVVGFLSGIEDSALNTRVVRGHRGVIEEQEGSSRIGDGGVGLRVRLDLAVADLEGLGAELPEPSRFIHGGELDGAGELAGVDFAKFIGANGVVLEVGGKDGLLQCRHDVVEKGGLRLSLAVHGDGVDVGEAEAEESVSVGVFDEAAGDGSRQLNGLRRDRCTSNVHLVDADLAVCLGGVAVMDRESGTRYGLESGGFGGIVNVGSHTSFQHICRHFRVENPQIRRSRVEVHAERLPSDGDGRQEFGVTLLRLACRDTPRRGLASCSLHLRGGSQWCGSDIRDGRLVHLSPPVFPECLVHSYRAVGDIVYIPALSLDFKGPALYFCCRSCRSRSKQKSDGEQ